MGPCPRLELRLKKDQLRALNRPLEYILSVRRTPCLFVAGTCIVHVSLL